MNLELWGGVECTVNRVGPRYFDQLEKNGHAHRLDDLDRFAELGLRTLRYPILWERVQPHAPDRFEWAWSDARMERLRTLGIRPVVGLLHHGSGPRWTDLLDPDFPRKFATYARAVAERYPWVEAYTPVNEPLTTARFSALYGHWFPHRTDDQSFVRVLLNQIEGVARAMKEIRAVQPQAILVQTEDLGKTFSTGQLEYQADFENERRWISFDLLNGKFLEGHPLWTFITGTQVDREQIALIADHPCPPDIYGINYYVTSERFLDEKVDVYPEETHGHNLFHRYADVAAVRTRPEGLCGLKNLLLEVWQRYRGPIAVTEAHLGCTREEQVRWLMEIWETAQHLKTEGVDLRAVTAWALLGAFDWNTLVTRETGEYESGAFDIRTGKPRATALAKTAQALLKTGKFAHPVLDSRGWWHRPGKLRGHPSFDIHLPDKIEGRPILILGSQGSVGHALTRVCQARGLACLGLSRQDADICDDRSVRRAIDKYCPWAVINAAGYQEKLESDIDAQRCFDVNAVAAISTAKVCAEAGLPYVMLSTDLVFDGEKNGAYVESDAARPLGAFGRSKAYAEKQIASLYPDALMVRTSPLFGPWNTTHFAAEVLQIELDELLVPSSRISPTYVPDLCHALLDLLIDGESGIWHLANEGALSWKDFAVMLARQFAWVAGSRQVTELHPLPSTRPAQSVLTSQYGRLMPSLENAVSRFHDDFLPFARRLSEGRTVSLRTRVPELHIS